MPGIISERMTLNILLSLANRASAISLFIRYDRLTRRFIYAADRGDMVALQQIFTETRATPSKITDIIRARNYLAYRVATLRGHLPVIEAIWGRMSGQDMENTIHTAFYLACIEGHSDVLQAILDKASDEEVTEMIQKSISSNLNDDAYRTNRLLVMHASPIFKTVAHRGYTGIVNLLLSFPAVFAHAAGLDEYDHYVRPFIKAKIRELRQRTESPNAPPSIVITEEEALLCAYILSHLMNQENASIHRNDTDFLMNIPAVLEHHQQHTMPEKTLGLRELARDKESAVRALTPAQEEVLAVLQAHYGPSSLQPFLEALQARYQATPAYFMRKNERVQLPMHHRDFQALIKTRALSLEEQKDANIAYYRHPIHTVLRYISRPNHWMSPDALHVLKEQNGLYANLTEYLPLMALLWQAAADPHTPGVDGYSVETRIDCFIQSIALMARAHNWDPKKETSQESDDLHGDKPSCYSGVRLRLLNALQGHPCFIGDIATYVERYFLEQVHTEMQVKITQSSTAELETLYRQYLAFVRGERENRCESLNISKNNQDSWCIELQQRLSFFSQSGDVIQQVRQTLFESPHLTSHFLMFVSRLSLNQLLLAALQMRKDSLIYQVTQQSNVVLTSTLRPTPTDTVRLLDAIEMKLLGEIGKRYRATPKIFAQLLMAPMSPVTSESPYENSPCIAPLLKYDVEQVIAWLQYLETSDRDAFMAVYQAAARAQSFQPQHPIVRFVAGQQQAFGTLYSELQTSAHPIETASQWLSTHSTHPQAHQIRLLLQHVAPQKTPPLSSDPRGVMLRAFQKNVVVPAVIPTPPIEHPAIITLQRHLERTEVFLHSSTATQTPNSPSPS